MTAYPMSNAQVSPADWVLPQGRAQRLPRSAQARELRVLEGRVWMTRSGRLEDCWLSPGERGMVAAGEEVVLEGWPQARFELLLAAPPLSAAAAERASPRKRAPLLVLPPPFGPRAPCSPCAS